MTSGGRQLPLVFAPRPALGRDDFLVTDSNHAAIAWIDRWPDWPAQGLVVSGPRASGKTHLAHVFRERTGAPIIAGGSLRGFESGTGEGLFAPERVRAARALVIDDADQVADGRDLLHVINFIRENGASVLLTATRPAGHWRAEPADLASRLAAMGAATIAPPDDHLLAAVISKAFSDRQVRVGDDVMRYLLARIERSFEAARDIAARLDAVSLARGQKVSVPLARAVLEDQGRAEGD